MESSSSSNSNGGRKGSAVRVFDSVEDLSTGLVEHVAKLSEAAVKEKGSFSLVLSGGADLLFLLQKMSRGPYLMTVDWSRWLVFWAEENVVPKNHPDSHYKLTKEAFLSKVPLTLSKVFPAVATRRTSTSSQMTAESVAEDYEFRIRQVVKDRIVDVSMSTDCPRFDLILLLLGPNGGVAALNPDDPSLLLGLAGDTQCPWVAPVRSRPEGGKNTMESVTMTLPVFNSAAQVAVVAVGKSVAGAVASAIKGAKSDDGDNVPPANLISTRNGELVWFVDANASSYLS